MAAELIENRNLRGSKYDGCDLSEVHFRNVLMFGTRITGALLANVEIDAGLEGPVMVNGVDITPLVRAERERQHPELVKLRPTDADGFREGWAVVEAMWPSTIERARSLSEEQLHERVDGEWSVIENLRHLVMATDSWVKGAMLGDPSPFHPLALPFTEMGEIEGVPNDPDARPSLDEILAVRADRFAVVRGVVDALTDEQLSGTTIPNAECGYPEANAYPVDRCLLAVLNEEWEHRRFIERTMDALEEA